jgi:AraC family transcriptional regulator
MSELARVIPWTTLSPGIVVAEQVQPTGACSQTDSSSHVFVLQAKPVSFARQSWEGVRREGGMPSGELAVLPAGLPMDWQWEGTVQSLHVCVDTAVAHDLTAGLLNRARVEVVPQFSLADVLARHLMDVIGMEAAAGTDALRAEELVQQLLTRVSPGRAAPGRRIGRGLPPSRLNEVLDWVEDHVSQPISTRQLAAVAGAETSWFNRLFTASVGCSPYRYVLRRRVLHAQRALRAGTAPAAAAAMCGFVDQAHLTRHFKALVGTTPAAWARHIRD